MEDAAGFKTAVQKLLKTSTKKKAESKEEDETDRGDSRNMITFDDYYSRKNQPWDPEKQKKKSLITFTFGQYYTVNLAVPASAIKDGQNVFAELAAAITEAGKEFNMQIYSTNFSFTSSFADELRQRGEVEALKKAQSLATKQAQALKIPLGKVKAVNPPGVSSSASPSYYTPMSSMARKSAAGASKSMEISAENDEEDQVSNTEMALRGDLKKLSSTFSARIIFAI
jgi:hypothetical protein